jgi:hypothetical protein
VPPDAAQKIGGGDTAAKADDGSTSTLETTNSSMEMSSSPDQFPAHAIRRVSDAPAESPEMESAFTTPSNNKIRPVSEPSFSIAPEPPRNQFRSVSESPNESVHHHASPQTRFRSVSESTETRYPPRVQEQPWTQRTQSRRVSDVQNDSSYSQTPAEVHYPPHRGESPSVQSSNISRHVPEEQHVPRGSESDSQQAETVEAERTPSAGNNVDALAIMAAVAMTELFGRTKEESSTTTCVVQAPESSESEPSKIPVEVTGTEAHESAMSMTPEKEVIEKPQKRKSITDDDAQRPPKKRRSPSPHPMAVMHLKGKEEEEDRTKVVGHKTSSMPLESRNPSPVSHNLKREAAATNPSPVNHNLKREAAGTPYSYYSAPRTTHYRSPPPHPAHSQHYGHHYAPSAQTPPPPHGGHYYHPYNPSSSSPPEHPKYSQAQASPSPYHQYNYHPGHSHHVYSTPSAHQYTHSPPHPSSASPAPEAALPKQQEAALHSAVTENPSNYEELIRSSGLPTSLSF